MTVLLCPGRTTRTHDQFISEFSDLKLMRIVTLDTGTGQMPYHSGSNDLVFCSSERYNLELHRFLTISPAHSYIRSVWEEKFDNGRDWNYRCRILASYNSLKRGKIISTWSDMSTYYCILCMSSFHVSYDKWRLVSEHIPTPPDYDMIRSWSESHRNKSIKYMRRGLFNFDTTLVDSNTLIYIHLPNTFASYGCGYVWTARKLDYVAKELTDLARLGYRVCISFLHTKWGRKVTNYIDRFDPGLFKPYFYSELKASRYGFNNVATTEVYLVANFN